MSRVLNISNKILSLRGRMTITDGNGDEAYNAVGELAFVNPTWQLLKDNDTVAKITRKTFSWTSRWFVEWNSEIFEIKRKLFSFVRKYSVIGGSFDSVELIGSLTDLKFNISKNDHVIAKANAKILTIRGVHSIEIFDDQELTEQFVAIMMVVLLMEKRSEENNRDDD